MKKLRKTLSWPQPSFRSHPIVLSSAVGGAQMSSSFHIFIRHHRKEGGMSDIKQSQLTRSQRHALLHVRRCKNVFITGGAGVGKSALVSFIIQDFKVSRKNVIVCASTGIAALNIDGVTVHSFFGFPLGCCINPGGASRPPSIRERVPQALLAADVLIIDEVSMMRKDLFDAVISSVRKAERLKGQAIQLIVVGDFFQLGPTGLSSPYDKALLESFYGPATGEFAFQGIMWDSCNFYTVILDETIRQKDPSFVRALNLLRIGDLSALPYLNEAVGRKNRAEPISLSAYNQTADEVNRRRLDALEGEAVTFKTEIVFEKGYNRSALERVGKDAIPPDLALKIGARVIITANDYHGRFATSLSLGKGQALSSGEEDNPHVVNGMMGTVYHIGEYKGALKNASIIIKADTGYFFEIIPLTRRIAEYVPSKRIEKKVVATCLHFPLKLAYGQTIHRSLGQTLDEVELSPKTFMHGQLYTGLSRVRTREGLLLTRPIRPEDLIIDQAVIEFYEKLGKGGLTKKKVGRPVAGPEAKKRFLWVPAPLVAHVQKEIRQGRITKLTGEHPYSSDRKHVRIPESLFDEVKEQIDTWKKDKRR